MEKNKKTLIITTAVLVLVVIGYMVAKKEIISRATQRDNEYISSFLRQGVPNPKEPLTTYTNSDYDISFDYPTSWGTPEIISGVEKCPPKSSLYTPETLNVYDKEIRFKNLNLANTESFIRTGVKLYRLDPNNLNDCGDELLLAIAKGEFGDAYSSSFAIGRVWVPEFLFTHYRRFASLANTNGLQQYTHFTKFESDGKLVIAQFYSSLISVPGSKEIKEMEEKFNGNVYAFMENGGWAYPFRMFQEYFIPAGVSFRFADNNYEK